MKNNTLYEVCWALKEIFKGFIKAIPGILIMIFGFLAFLGISWLFFFAF